MSNPPIWDLQGISIEKLEEGIGEPPGPDDYVTVHYVIKTMRL